MAVNDAAGQLGQRHRLALRLAGDVAKAIDERHVGGVHDLRRTRHGLVHRRRLAVHQGIRIQPLRRVILEPRLAQAARALGLDDLLPLGVQLDVVADAAAEGASGVFDNRQGRAILRSSAGPNRSDERVASSLGGVARDIARDTAKRPSVTLVGTRL